MKKRVIMAMMSAVICAAVFCGCSLSEKTEPAQIMDQTDANATDNAKGENAGEDVSLAGEADDGQMTGMANPYVEVSGCEKFEEQLGIVINGDVIPGRKSYVIIANEIAQIDFEMENVNSELVKYELRATKKDYKDEMLHGHYDTDLVDGSSIDYEGDNGIINLDYIRANTEKIDIWTWSFEGLNCSLTCDNETSGNQISAVLDAVMAATGVDSVDDLDSADNTDTDNTNNTETSPEGLSIIPLDEGIDVNNLTDCELPCTINFDTLKNTDDGMTVDFEIYTMDLYDAVAMNNMNIGDTIEVDGENIVVNSIDEKNGVIYVNGGEEEGGAEFISNGGGTYRYFGMDDYATYTNEGTVNLEIGKDASLTDNSNMDEPDGVTVKGSDLYDYFEKSDKYFFWGNTTVRIEDGKVVEIVRKFVP